MSKENRHSMMASLGSLAKREIAGRVACGPMATSLCLYPSCQPKKLRYGHKHRLRKK